MAGPGFEERPARAAARRPRQRQLPPEAGVAGFLAAVQRTAGNRAAAALVRRVPVQRWLERTADGWQENNRPPVGMYRYTEMVEGEMHGFESPAAGGPFVMTDWHRDRTTVPGPERGRSPARDAPAGRGEKRRRSPSPPRNEKPKRIRGGSDTEAEPEPQWYDDRRGRWRTGQPDPRRYRPATPDDRLRNATDMERTAAEHGYPDGRRPPVFVRRKFRRVVTPQAPDPRGPGLRMRDRVGRVAYVDRRGGTPHLSVVMRPGDDRLTLAGNTGKRHVTTADREAGERQLDDAYGAGPLPRDRRRRQDYLKLRALKSGDYQATHGGIPSLGDTRRALTKSSRWLNVDRGGRGQSEHGEMTTIGVLLADLRRRPPAPPGQVEELPVGGVKCSCRACQWAIDAFNAHIGPRYGCRLAVSGTHGLLFPGWKMPDWLRDDRTARDAVVEQARRAGWRFEDGVLVPPRDFRQVDRDQNPADSESEWEEMSD
ncbi:hypothetical protein [Fodinicola acaciae]|uniref:hypothetical protein n=1 Tax=Fodinicola acaciae TaxID=2681555 RepID=UPI0013D4C227|nr:hypothetical protein [Fodinicola acaciae]